MDSTDAHGTGMVLPEVVAAVRLNIVPEPAFQALQARLAEQLAGWAGEIHAAEFAGLMDPLLREVFHRGVAEAGADEGTIWLADAPGRFLEPAYNTGPQPEKLVGRVRQPANQGLISMVFASEQPVLENAINRNPGHSPIVDEHLKMPTMAMIAVPLYFLAGCRGVVSAVQLGVAGGRSMTAGFRAADLASLQRAASVLTRLVDLQVLGGAVGWHGR